MVGWTAADFALVITSATTAITALSSIALPLYTQWRNGHAIKKAALYESFFQPLMVIVVNAKRVSLHALEAKMNMAYMAAGLTGQDLAAGKSLDQDYDAARRKLALLAHKYGVEMGTFDLAALSMSVCPLNYDVVDGKLIETTGGDAETGFTMRMLECVNTLTREAKHVLNQVEKLKP
jgi:hypothetical protein